MRAGFREALHPVEHAAPGQTSDEVLLIEVENAPVVGDLRPSIFVANDERIVAEALPNRVPGTDRHEEYLEVRARRGSGRGGIYGFGRNLGAHGNEAPSEDCDQDQEATGSHGREPELARLTRLQA